MYLKNQQFGRREFLKLVGLAGMAFATGICWAETTFSSLDYARTSTGLRIVGTVSPVGSVWAWAIQRSTDGGVTWITLEDEGVVIGSGRIRWDVPILPNEPTGIFRLKLITVLRIGNKTYRITANGQTLFEIMDSLRTANPYTPPLFVSDDETTQEGQFVTAMNGVEGKWVFEVNGQKIDDNVDVGISEYIPGLGCIEWKRIP